MARTRTLTAAEGREYPASILDPAIVKRDRIVQKVMKRAQRLHTSITNEKERMSAEVEKYLDDLAAQYDETWKGNAELVSFDGLFKVEVRNRERITFGVELQLAKQKIDECLKRWSQDSNINLRAIINEAFQVDKKGQIAKHRILGLRRYNIKDANWKDAMKLIDKAIQVTSTRQYLAFYQRGSIEEPFKLIPLNFSAI